MVSLRSWTDDEIIAAYKNGKKIFVLDTGTAGQDDILIGNTYQNVLVDVLDNEEVSELPKGWNIEEIGEGDDPLCALLNV